MIIEKSPHHNFNNKTDNHSKIKKDNNDQVSDKSFNFWEWIKGAISPLQNLPVVSGIYSSVNSEDKNSDRDLVQSSTGGFLYGGPIGAMVGAGSWIFNKIFDKTPAEMVLDASGISKLWKENNAVLSIAQKSVDHEVTSNKNLLELSRNIDESKQNRNLNNNNEYSLISDQKNIDSPEKMIGIKNQLSKEELTKSKGMNIEYPKWTPNIEGKFGVKDEFKKSTQLPKPNAMYNIQPSLEPNKRLFDIKA